MGEFNAAVSTLLEAFSSGIAIIRSLRRRRKENKSEIDSTMKAEESRLSKSLKKNRVHVQSVYKTKLDGLGRRFADGDGKPPEIDHGGPVDIFHCCTSISLMRDM
jgi:hypothetical protein